MSKRIRWFGLAMIVCFCGLLIQLDNIQGLKAKQYQNASTNPVQIEADYAEPRGTIVSSDGVVLAQSVPTPNSPYYKYEREYPTGSLFAQVVGFTSYIGITSPSNPGYTGVENEYNSYLTYRQQPARTLGDLLQSQEGTDTVDLTLSNKFQSLAKKALGNKDGAVVVLNPADGAVLAMYSNPTFDPNALASQNGTEANAAWVRYNKPDSEGIDYGTELAYNDASFHPGSTFKLVTSAAAFDHDPSVTTKTFPILTNWTPPDTNQVLHNDDGACGGLFTGPLMLPKSCDTGFAQAGIDIGAANLTTEAGSFGFWSRPPIDLPTSPYSVSNMCGGGSTFTDQSDCGVSLEADQPNLAYSAIGQGSVDATPLQMAMVTSAIADDGVIMTPHVMSRILDPKDDVIDTYQPKPWLKATSAQTAASVSKMMQLVVSNPNGTAYGIFPSSWDVAAKTGTAQQGVGNTATTDWMVAFAPANNPQVAIAVMVPNQAKTASGAGVSGPIVKTVLSGLFGGAG